jgi:8-oxo-dGTP pyrophosphatase MutT (NUDIX family)
MFTVRSRQLRSHAGEVSFPGGLFDQAADVSLDQTAVRETIEELPSFSAVRLLGRLPAVPDRSGTIAVHPFVGYVGEFHHRDGVGENKFGRRRQQLFHCDSNGPVQFNPSEVSDCFFLSLEHLLDPKNTIMMQLRRSDSSLMVPSWIGVERQSIAAVENDDTGLDPVNSVQTPDGHLHYRVWGLTAFILSRYLNRVIEPLLGHRC